MIHALRVPLLATLMLLGLAGTALAAADEPAGASAFDRILEPYERIRVALTLDSLDGVHDEAETIAKILDTLAADWSPRAAGIALASGDDVQGLLPTMIKAAADLAEVETLASARDAFYELSKPLVRWRKEVSGDRPAVAYCPMAKRSWLQPEGDLTNPYHGQSMLRCGEIVDS